MSADLKYTFHTKRPQILRDAIDLQKKKKEFCSHNKFSSFFSKDFSALKHKIKSGLFPMKSNKHNKCSIVFWVWCGVGGGEEVNNSAYRNWSTLI